MANTVDNSFIEFNREIVNLNSNITETANNSRDWLVTQLSSLDMKDGLDFPYEYIGMHVKYGSFARKTKIRELDDIDLLFCLKADGAYYTKIGDTYVISSVNSGQRLQNLSDNGTLNSRKIVNKFVNSLYELRHYKSAEIHRKGEAATLKLDSYVWVYDIVPAFYTDTALYLIPDGNGNWKATDPRIDQKLLTETNQSYESKVLQLIRTLKYWNRHNSTYTLGSYLFEQIVINFVKSKYELSTYMDFNIRDFFNYLSINIYNSVYDPKGIQGDINNLILSEKDSVSLKADWAYNKAKDAVFAETNEKNQEKSINKWREIFGNNFPQYG
ncbi:hypothetical protein [Chryseobacterium sp. ERMR1:04]|uniref:hypothetical protein n=1 Tax=Chryseobacterium sp. ERMR1:04 TaxID=1705393 RepID=UPI0006C8DEFF|nr:hypothetical protein [Chryseobacterium sp. ERMR1:04]KPH14057.1 hypothetical protein AMQ68_00580 [Chryseobacterium sp. ERMR1:04]